MFKAKYKEMGAGNKDRRIFGVCWPDASLSSRLSLSERPCLKSMVESD